MALELPVQSANALMPACFAAHGSLLNEEEEEDEDEDSEDDVLSLGSGPSGAIGLRISELIDLAAGEVDGPRGLGSDDEVCFLSCQHWF
jgi:hypothetical protein